jgi:hypothetical protein
MKTKITLLFCFLLNLLFYDSHALEATTVTGGNLTGTGGSISYTIGQVTNLYLNETKGSVAQVVQLP